MYIIIYFLEYICVLNFKTLDFEIQPFNYRISLGITE